MSRSIRISIGMALLPVMLLAAAPKSAPEAFLARGGQPEAVIFAGSGEFNGSVARELQQYLEALTGARLEIVTTVPKGKTLVLVGSPATNQMVPRTAGFANLKEGGYILKRITAGGQPALVVGGNDEAGTMYAAYDLLERLGFVFLLTKDIVPARQSAVRLPSLDERVEPAYRRRGVHVDFCYPNQTIWSLEYWKKFIDRMARMRMNYLQVFWFPHAPFLTYDYKGEKNFMGDVATKESGYLLWATGFGSHLSRDMVVGREHFTSPRLAPPEYQNVETPDQAFEIAQNMLRQVIAYAKVKKIKTWLAIDPVSLPANLARHARARTGDLPFHPIMGGVYMCPVDPVVDEINENRLKSLVSTYPEAEGYFLWFPELYPVCEDDKSKEYQLQQRPKDYAEELRHWKHYTGYARAADRVVDSNNAAIYLMKKVIEARDRMNPKPKVGIGAFGRSFVYPIIDRVFPKDVPFTDMVSQAIWTPMGVPLYQFGNMGERERTLISRSDDDSGMLGMQFNVNLYYKDRMYNGALEHGIAGHAMQVNRARGQEHNEKFLADAAWKPKMTPEEFYQDYVKRIFGEAAAPDVVRAYRILEKNEEELGWTQQSNFGCCGPISEINIVKSYADQGNPYDGPTFQGWSGFLENSRAKILYFRRSADLLRQAADVFAKSRGAVSEGGRAELAYLQNKTEAYAMHLEALIEVRQAYMELDAAFRARNAGRREEFLERLDRSMEMFRSAGRMSRAMGAKFAEIIDDPSDLGVLYRINIFVVHGFDIVEKFMQNIVNFHHGKYYLNPVPFETVFSPLPKIQTGRVW
jgi:hypothetical protein